MQDSSADRLTLVGVAIGLMHKCPYSDLGRHKDCYMEYIRKGRTEKEMLEVIKSMSDKQLRRLISHHNECPLWRDI